MGSICTKPDAIAVAVLSSTASSDAGLRSHDVWPDPDAPFEQQTALSDSTEDHARQSPTDVVTRVQSGSQEHAIDVQGGRSSLPDAGEAAARDSRLSRAGLAAGSVSTVPRLPSIMNKGQAKQDEDSSAPTKERRTSAPTSPRRAPAATGKKDRNSHNPPGHLELTSPGKEQAEAGQERDSSGSNTHFEDSMLTTDPEVSPTKSSPDATHLHSGDLVSHPPHDSSALPACRGSNHRTSAPRAAQGGQDVAAADQQRSSHARSKPRHDEIGGAHASAAGHERTSSHQVKPTMSAPVAVELAWPAEPLPHQPSIPLTNTRQAQQHPELPPPESVRSSADMFVIKIKEASEAAAAAAARLAAQNIAAPGGQGGQLDPMPPGPHVEHPTSASIRSSRNSSHPTGQGQPRSSASRKAPVQGARRTTHSTAPVDTDAAGIARAPSRTSRTSAMSSAGGQKPAPKSGRKPASAHPKQPQPPRPVSRQGQPPGQLQSQQSFSRLSYSTSEPVSGDVLGFPVNRYPAPKPGRQVPVEELAGVHGGSSWDVRPAAEPSMGAIEADCSMQSFRPSEIGDPFDLSELNASLPPSNFNTRHGTRRTSHVMDSKDSIRFGLPAGVDPQVAADAMQRLMAEASQTSQVSVASSYSYIPAASQAAAMIAMNSSRVNPPQGALAAPHRRSLSACVPQQPINASNLRTSGSMTNPYNSGASFSAGGAPAAPSAGAGACMINSGLGGMGNSLKAVPSLLMQLPGQQGFALHAHNEVDEEGQDEPASRGSTELPHDKSDSTVQSHPPGAAITGSSQPGYDAPHADQLPTQSHVPSDSIPAQQAATQQLPLQDPFAGAAKEASQALAIHGVDGLAHDGSVVAPNNRTLDMSSVGVRESWQPSDYCIPEEEPGPLEDGLQAHGSSAQPDAGGTAGLAASSLPPVGSFGGLMQSKNGSSHLQARPPAGSGNMHASHHRSRNGASMSLSEAAARRRTSLPMLSGFKPQASATGGFSATSSHCGAASVMGASGHLSDDPGMSMRSSAPTEDTDARFLSIQSRLAKTASDMNTARRNRFDPYYTCSSDDSEDQRVGTTPEVLERISLLLPPSRLTKESGDSPATSQPGAVPTPPPAAHQLPPHPPPTEPPAASATTAPAIPPPSPTAPPVHSSPTIVPHQPADSPAAGCISPRTSITLARTAMTVDRSSPVTADMNSGDSFRLHPSGPSISPQGLLPGNSQLGTSPPPQSRLCMASSPGDVSAGEVDGGAAAAMDVDKIDAPSALTAVLSSKESGQAGASPRLSQQHEPCDVPMMPDQELVAAC